MILSRDKRNPLFCIMNIEATGKRHFVKHAGDFWTQPLKGIQSPPKDLLYCLIPFLHYQSTLPLFCCSVVPMGLISWKLKFQRKAIKEKYLNKYKIPQIYYKNIHEVSFSSRTSIFLKLSFWKLSLKFGGNFPSGTFVNSPMKAYTNSGILVSFQITMLMEHPQG